MSNASPLMDKVRAWLETASQMLREKNSKELVKTVQTAYSTILAAHDASPTELTAAAREIEEFLKPIIYRYGHPKYNFLTPPNNEKHWKTDASLLASLYSNIHEFSVHQDRLANQPQSLSTTPATLTANVVADAFNFIPSESENSMRGYENGSANHLRASHPIGTTITDTGIQGFTVTHHPMREGYKSLASARRTASEKSNQK